MSELKEVAPLKVYAKLASRFGRFVAEIERFWQFWKDLVPTVAEPQFEISRIILAEFTVVSIIFPRSP